MVAETSDFRGHYGHMPWRSSGFSGPGALRQMLRATLAGWRYGGPAADQLLLVPQDLRTADPSFASEIYHGQFGLAGVIAQPGAESPFAVPPPSPQWEVELQGFGWLRHLRAAGDEVSREHARALVNDWLDLHPGLRGTAWRPEVTGRRLISWLSNSTMLLKGADAEFYDAVMFSLTRQLRYLSDAWRDGPDGAPRLLALSALVFAGLCMADQQAFADKHAKTLAGEFERQIHPDGGHLSRNPVVLVELLLDLLPLKQCFVARDRPVPHALTAAIGRIMPMLRFSRLGDGTLIRFNGTGVTPTDAMGTVLAYDDVHGAPVSYAAQSGYCRLEAKGTAVAVDAGRPPVKALAREAHAGCLAFEMSSGKHLLVVNCGAPALGNDDWRLVARATAAHSTLTLLDTSSSRFTGASAPGLSHAHVPLEGPDTVDARITEGEDGTTLTTSHDGYMAKYGIVHERVLTLAPDGARLSGEDRLIAPHGLKGEAAAEEAPFAIRFHLHPAVKAQVSQDGHSALLMLPNREGWRLTCEDAPLTLEESVYLADPRGPRRTTQVELFAGLSGGARTRVRWRLEKGAAKTATPTDAESDAETDADLFGTDAPDADEALLLE